MASTRKQNEALAQIIDLDQLGGSSDRRSFKQEARLQIMAAAEASLKTGEPTSDFAERIGLNPNQIYRWRTVFGPTVTELSDVRRSLSSRLDTQIKELAERCKDAPKNAAGQRRFGTDLRNQMAATYLDAKNENVAFVAADYCRELTIDQMWFSKVVNSARNELPAGANGRQLDFTQPDSDQEVLLEGIPTQPIASARVCKRRRVEVTAVIKIEAANVAQALAQLEQLPLEGRVEIAISPYKGG